MVDTMGSGVQKQHLALTELTPSRCALLCEHSQQGLRPRFQSLHTKLHKELNKKSGDQELASHGT